MVSGYYEDRRLVVSIGIVGTFVAALAVDRPESKLLELTLIVLASSAFCAFLYILLTAAQLKTNRQNDVGSIPFTDKFRAGCYNYSIDTFGYQAAGMGGYGIAAMLKWLGLINYGAEALGIIIMGLLILGYIGWFRLKRRRSID